MNMLYFVLILILKVIRYEYSKLEALWRKKNKHKHFFVSMIFDFVEETSAQ